MIVAHVSGIPNEEIVLQVAPACAAVVTAFASAARARFARLVRRVPRRCRGTVR